MKVDPAFVVANFQAVTDEVNELQAVRMAYNAALARVHEHQRTVAQVTVTLHVKPEPDA